MNIVSMFLARIGLDQPLHSLASEIAGGCRGDVLQRLSTNPDARSMNEARGFVRARSALVVGRAVGQHPAADQLSTSMRGRLVELVHQRLVDELAPTLYDMSQPNRLRRVA